MSTFTDYPKATVVTIYSLGIFLGLLHIFFGVVSLTPSLNQDYHREMRANYHAFAKNLSFLHKFVDTLSLALYLRYLVAGLESVFGALLLENGHFLKGDLSKIANIGLIIVDLVFVFFQFSVGSAYERIAPTIVFTLLLVTRLLIVEQSTKKVKVTVKTRNAGKPKTSTPKKNKNE